MFIDAESATTEVSESSEFGGAVGVVKDGVACVLLTARHESGLGPALLWAMKNSATALRLFTDSAAGDLARRAKNFDFKIDVFEVDLAGGSKLSAPATPEQKEVSAADEIFADFIVRGGADVVREHGVISGEVCGLEVCRVVRDDFDESRESQESRLEIGVGAHDRETFQLLHGRTATVESLRKVVTEVATRRVVGAAVHPLNQLARERMLRHIVCQSPDLVGASSLNMAAPPMPRPNLKDIVPCCATGVLTTGEKVVVIFCIGVDPDLVSFGADARQQLIPSAELIFAVPSRDIVPSIQRVANLLRRSARFVGLDVMGA